MAGLGAQRLRRRRARPATMPSRPGRMGFCLFNNAAVAALHARAALGPQARRGGGFRRASRQRHAGDVRRRPRPVLRLLPPASRAYPGTGLAEEARDRQQHRQRAAAARHRQPRLSAPPGPTAPAGARCLRAGAADRLGRVRCAQARPAGAAPAGDRRISPGSPSSFACWRVGIADAASFRCWRAATTSTRWRPRRRRMCAS